MGTIFYGVSGEGRGHATRAVTLIEDLRVDHRVVLYAPGLAYEILEPYYRDSEVEVRELPGLRFHYSAGRRLQYLKTGWRSLGYVAALPRLLASLERLARTRRTPIPATAA
jgi:Glycosyl transferase family 1